MYIIDLDGTQPNTAQWPPISASSPGGALGDGRPSYENGQTHYVAGSTAACSTSSAGLSVVGRQGAADVTLTNIPEHLGSVAQTISEIFVCEQGCGPCIVTPTTTTQMHCDRDYTFGPHYSSFFQGRQLYLLQDAHDPNDHGFTTTVFADLTFTGTAVLHCFVPSDHGVSDSPNSVDAVAGWVNTGEKYTESCRTRERFSKQVTGGRYTLYHTVHHEWGYVYMVEILSGGAVHELDNGLKPTLTVTDLHAGADCGPVVVEYPTSCTPVSCDRAYVFGDGIEPFLSGLRHPWLVQDAHDQNDVRCGRVDSEIMCR